MRARDAVATIVLLALGTPSATAAPGDVVLPSPAGPTSSEAVAMRLTIVPGNEGNVRVNLVATLLGGSAAPETLRLLFALEPAAVAHLNVARLGSPVKVTATDAGAEAALLLEPGEAVVVDASWRVSPGALPGLPAARAGWWGRTRGPLLQPLQRLAVRHPPGSPHAAAALEVSIRPAAHPLASAFVASAGAHAADGGVSWAASGLAGGQALELVWPATETESVLPRNGAEATAFADEWTGERSIAAAEVRLVRLGLDALHGLRVDDAAAAELLSPQRRPGWALRAGPPGADLLASAAVLAELEETVAGRAPVEVAARPAAPPVPPPGPGAPADEAPAATPAPPAAAPAVVAGSTPLPASPRHSPALQGRVDRSALVTVAPDDDWRSETLYETPASVPTTRATALRVVRRADRDLLGLSRVVLAREAILAVHGKQWAPGYVAEFFSRKAWYRPDPAFDAEALTQDQRASLQVLDDYIALRQGVPTAAAEVASAGMPAAAPLAPEPAAPAAVAPEPAAPAAVAPEPAAPAPLAPEPAAPAPLAAPAAVATAGPAAAPVAAPAAPAAVATAAPAATPDAPATTSPLPAAALPSPDQEPRAPVPWIQDARSARLFVARERASGGVDVARLREAAATIGARFGRPFVDDPVVRRLFSAEAWYVPIAGWTPDLLSTDAREALTVLGRELTQRGSSLP